MENIAKVKQRLSSNLWKKTRFFVRFNSSLLSIAQWKVMRTRQEAEPLENLVQIILITIDSKVRRLNKNNDCSTSVEMFFEALE